MPCGAPVTALERVRARNGGGGPARVGGAHAACAQRRRLRRVTHGAPRTAAHLLVDCLAAEGCEWVFSVPGEETMDVLEALADHGQVRHVTTRHEQGAAFMADVHGRLTGRCAVAMATLGPGATNLVTGIADAYLDRAPMVALTGQTGDRQDAQGVAPVHRHPADARARHEVDDPRRSAPARSPRSSPRRSASRSSRSPGPTHIELPGGRRGHDRGRRARAAAALARVLPRAHGRGDRACRRRSSPASSRPIVLAGNGVLRRHASPELARVRPRPPRPGRGDVHGQGRHGRPVAPVADGRRASRRATTCCRASTGPTS